MAAAVGPLQARTAPKLSGAWEWVSRHRDLGPRYLAEGTANSASSQLRNYGVGFILGLAAVGYVQAATTLMGPFMVIFFGMGLVTLPEAARILRRSPRHLPHFCLLVSAGLAVLGLAWGVVLLLALPRGLGQLMLGSSVETDLPAGVADHDPGPRRMRQRRRWHWPACPGSSAAKPARNGPRVGAGGRPQPRGRCRGRGSRDHDRCRGGVVDRRAAVLAAAPHGAAGAQPHGGQCPSRSEEHPARPASEVARS